jgi:hypothetical protein
LALAFGLLVAAALGGVLAVGHAAPTSARLTTASGSTQQWAFGGIGSASFSCSGSACGAGSQITSLTLKYYLEWAVIFTETNISATQTEFEVQGAINASVSISLSGCVNTSASGPCSQTTLSANVNGAETAAGFTNVTTSGVTVNLTAGPDAPANVSAVGIMNSQSSANYNFSGSFSLKNATLDASANFDFGGSEASTITFPTALGLLPISPQPGQWWNSSGAYSATGNYKAGYSASATVNGQTNSTGEWATLNVAPSGILSVTGTDIGSYTLTDNYTSPPTSITAQEILLSFSTGEFTGSDGYLLLPSGLYGTLAGFSLIAHQHPMAAPVVSTGESEYYQSGVGFVGGAHNENASALGASGASVSLKAGPEPVSIAQSQYQAIESSQSSPASSSSFPWVWLIAAVVVVVVVLGLVALMVRRSRGRRPPATTPATAGNTAGPSTGGPDAESTPSTMAPTSAAVAAPTSAAASAAGTAGPVCPTCGQPGTYVAQYNRYYCYTDKTYL